MSIKQDFTPQYWIFCTDDLIAHYEAASRKCDGYENSCVAGMAQGLKEANIALLQKVEQIKNSGIDLLTVKVIMPDSPTLDASNAIRQSDYAIAFNHLARYYGDHNPNLDHSTLKPAGALYDKEDALKAVARKVEMHVRQRDTAQESWRSDFEQTMVDSYMKKAELLKLSGQHPAGLHVRFNTTESSDENLTKHLHAIKSDLDCGVVTFGPRV